MSTLKYLATLGTGFQRSTISNGGAGYSTGATSIVVADGTVFPAAGDFWVGVGESSGLPHFIKRATARTGNTITVDAAVIAGTDQNEADGVVVQWTLPPEALDQLRQDQCQTGADASKSPEKAGNLYLPNNGIYARRDTGSGWGNWGPIIPCTEPILTDFAAVDIPTASAVTTYGGIHITGGNNTSAEYMRTASLSTPWRIEVGLSAVITSANYSAAGILLRAGASGAIIKYVIMYSGGSLALKTQLYDSSNAYVGEGLTGLQVVGAYNPRNMLLGVRDDGTTRYFESSIDGIYWSTLGSQARTTYAAVDRGGIFSYNTSASFAPNTRFWHYKETS
jgi:hypothetical protein